MDKTIFASSPNCEILSTRTVNANKELVFKAWTNPEHLKNWWGPTGFTNTFKEFDLRIGGKWSFIMHGPDKGNYPNECEFIVIDKPNLIAWKRHSKPLFNVVASFEEITPQQTKIVWRMIFSTEKECNKIKAFAANKNEENLDKLEKELELMALGSN